MTGSNPAYDRILASKGRDLHARLLDQAHVHPFYRDGSLFGVATREPKAAICVPVGTWARLNEDDRATLRHYAASLVEPMKADPLRFSQIPGHAPAAEALRRNARGMGAESWVIIEGRLKAEGEGAPFDILTDKPIASGSDDSLGA